jgi:hypothetical protein
VTETPLVFFNFKSNLPSSIFVWAGHLVYVDFLKEGCFLFGFFVGII